MKNKGEGWPLKLRKGEAQGVSVYVRDSDFRVAVEWTLSFLAAERRQSEAHGVSRGSKWEMNKPRRGER